MTSSAVGRDPAEIVRSVQLPLRSYDDPAPTRRFLREQADVGFTHFVLNPPAPYPEGVARWVADQLVRPTVDHISR